MSYPDPDPHRRPAPQGQPYGPPIVPGPPPGQYPHGPQQQPWAPQQPDPYPNQGAAGYPPQRPPQGTFPPPGPTVVVGSTHKPKRRRWPLIVAVIVVAGVCIGVGSALINSGSNSTNSANDATVSSPAAGQAAGGAPASKGAPAAPKTLLTFTGNGIKKSQVFTTGREWTMRYSFDCSSMGQSGNFIVDEYDASGNLTDSLVNALQLKGADSVPQHSDPGSHYLDVNSECSWSITVTG